MKKIITFITTFLIGLMAATYLFQKFGFEKAIILLNQATLLPVIYYILTVICIMLTISWRWHVILKSQNIKINFLKIFYYRIAGFMASYVTPIPRVGGEGLRILLLKKEKIPLKKSVASVLIDTILDLTTMGFLFLTGVFFLISSNKLLGPANNLLIISSTLFIGFMIWLYHGIITEKGIFTKIIKKIPKLKENIRLQKKIKELEILLINFYKRDQKRFLQTLLISLLAWILMFAEYKFLLLILGFDASFIQLFFIITFIGLAYSMPLPLAIGSLEAGQVSAAIISGLSSSFGLAISLIVRMKDLFWVLIGLIISTFTGLNYLRKKTTS